jgi:thimet oligopeptidase
MTTTVRTGLLCCGAAGAIAALAWGCAEQGGGAAAKPGAVRPADAGAAAKPVPKEEEKPVMKPEVPASAISGELFEPPIPKSPAEMAAYCKQWLDAATSAREALAVAAAPRTVDNTLMKLNDVYIDIDHVLPFSELIANVHPDKKVRTAAEKCQQDAMKLLTDIGLDRRLFDALTAVDVGGADPLAVRSRDHLLRDYRRSGVDKDDATRKRLRALKEEMVKVGQEFSRRVREDKRTVELAPAELAGLPADFLKSHPPGKNGKIAVTTEYPDYFPVLSYADAESARKALFVAFQTRAYPANQKVLEQLLALRSEYAGILGYPNWAEYAAEDKMVKDEKTISAFIDRVAELSRPRMASDIADMLARKKQDVPGAEAVNEWDRMYYTKKIQTERFGVDSQEVRKYFDFPLVKDGLLAMNAALFGVRFDRAPDAPTWHESVEAYDVVKDGARIGRFYLDLHPRDGKYGHAAMFQIGAGISGRQLPTASLVCNFPKPAAGAPALMEYADVTTFFHEFGHLMHHILGSGYKYANLTGLNCEWDFVEAPSQILEEWARDAGVLARFTKHSETGAPIPKELVDKMRAADEFGKGTYVMRQLFLAGLSLAYHQADPSKFDLLEVMKSVQAKYSPYPYEPGTFLFANFTHLEGYGSMYYTYMWSLKLSKDLFTRFAQEGLMDPGVAADYTKYVVGAGGAVDADVMVENFLGRPSSFDAFEKYLKE